MSNGRGGRDVRVLCEKHEDSAVLRGGRTDGSFEKTDRRGGGAWAATHPRFKIQKLVRVLGGAFAALRRGAPRGRGVVSCLPAFLAGHAFLQACYSYIE